MTRLVSFCFDDGFQRTAERVLTVFASRDLHACFCVLAAAEVAQDPFIRASPIANWSFWREARDAGHEVAPHGYSHEHLGRLTNAEAQTSLRRTLEIFTRELSGFQPADAIFHLPYLTAPPPVIAWLGERTLGVRASWDRTGLNDPELLERGRLVNCIAFGPDGVDGALLARIDRFISDEDGWLVLVLHGLDGEGWGTCAGATLETGLDRLLAAGVTVAPPGEILTSLLADKVA